MGEVIGISGRGAFRKLADDLIEAKHPNYLVEPVIHLFADRGQSLLSAGKLAFQKLPEAAGLTSPAEDRSSSVHSKETFSMPEELATLYADRISCHSASA